MIHINTLLEKVGFERMKEAEGHTTDSDFRTGSRIAPEMIFKIAVGIGDKVIQFSPERGVMDHVVPYE